MEQSPENDNKQDSPIAATAKTTTELTLVGHLEELRNRLMVSAVVLVVSSSIAYVYAEELLKFLIAPAGKLYFMNPAEGFFAYMKVSIFAGILASSPIIFYQAWAFVAPALMPKERAFLLALVPFAAIMFVGGVAFAYFLAWPVAIKFFLGFGSESLQPMLSLGQYLSFLISFIFPFGIVFNLPLFIFVLAKMGFVTSRFLSSKRKMVIFLAFVIGAVISPSPDVFSQTLMAVPMIILYEMAILGVRYILRK